MNTLNVKGQGQTPVDQIDDKTLKWYATECRNQEYCAVAQEELMRRKQGGAMTVASRGTSVPSAPIQSLGKAIQDPASVSEYLAKLSQQYHVVSPAMQVDTLPEGFGVSVSFVQVDPANDTYRVGDKRGLNGDCLKRIWAAAGGSWLTEKSRRLDDGSDPHYCHFRAVGVVRGFDNSPRRVSGEVEIDMREGSPQVKEIRDKAALREADPEYRGKRDGGASQILEIRKFILRHAESKAKNRATADLGVKRSYTREELRKPFAIARLFFTGQSADPELSREFAMMGAAQALGAERMLYGSRAEPMEHRPPPIGTTAEEFDESSGPDSEPPAPPPPVEPEAQPSGDDDDTPF
jgi:hypothetical protein